MTFEYTRFLEDTVELVDYSVAAKEEIANMIVEDTVDLVDYSVAGKEEVASMILEDTVNLVDYSIAGKDVATEDAGLPCPRPIVIIRIFVIGYS